MQIDLSTEYVKMADLLSVDPVGLQVKVQVISGNRFSNGNNDTTTSKQ